jgi:hypothetical protein
MSSLRGEVRPTKMKQLCRWTIVLLLLLESCGATSIVWVVSETGKYVVLAADSRDFNLITRESDDKVCKVIALDDTLFLNSGDVRLRTRLGDPWESLQIAKEIYKTSKDHGAQALSIGWANRAMAWFGGQNPSDVQLMMQPDGGLVTGGFINFDLNKNPAVFAQSLHFDSVTRQPLINTTSQLQIGIAGIQRELVQEFIKAETPRALKAYETLKSHNVGKGLPYDREFVRQAVQFVIDNVTGKEKFLVHGPIDVVVIRRFGGIDWIHRKDECYKEDFRSRREKGHH